MPKYGPTHKLCYYHANGYCLLKKKECTGGNCKKFRIVLKDEPDSENGDVNGD